MSEESNGPTGPQGPPSGPPPGSLPPGYPPAAEPGTGPHAPYAPPPHPQAPYAGHGPTQPMPQWYPAVPRTPFRDRVIRLWAALAVAAACLVVGLGVGIAIGHATSDDDRGPGRFDRFPGGPGRPDFGQRDGNGPFGFRNRERAPDDSDRGPQQTPQPPTPTPSG